MQNVFKVFPESNIVCSGSMLVAAMSREEAIDVFYGMYDDVFCDIKAERVSGLVYDGTESVIENGIRFNSTFIEWLV